MDRKLTREEVLNYFDTAAAPLPTYKRFRPRTNAKDASLMKAYREMTKLDELTEAGIKKVLIVILEQNRHVVSVQHRLKKTRPMSYPSFAANWVNGFRRLWYDRFLGVSVPTSLALELERMLTEASFMPESSKAASMTTAESWLLITALPQGSKKFFRDAFMISFGDEHAARVGSLEGLCYGDITSIEEITSGDREVAENRLLKVTIGCGSTKRQLDTAVNVVEIIGNPFVDFGICDTVFFLDAATREEFGIPLMDAKGVTIVSKMKKTRWNWLRNMPLYYQSTSRLSKVYRKAARNTTLPSNIVLTPRCHRVGFFSRVTVALQAGRVASANSSALALAMRHTQRSSIGRDRYLEGAAAQTVHFGSLWSSNPVLAARPVHQPLGKTVKEHLKLEFEPTVRGLPDRRNLDILRGAVRDRIWLEDYGGEMELAKAITAEGDFDTSKGVPFPPSPASSRVSYRIKQLTVSFGRCALTRAVRGMTDAETFVYTSDVFLRTLSSLKRPGMQRYVDKILKYWE